MPSGSRIFDRPELFLDKVSELNRHSKMSCPMADRSRSPTCFCQNHTSSKSGEEELTSSALYITIEFDSGLSPDEVIHPTRIQVH